VKFRSAKQIAILPDTISLPVGMTVHSADAQDRDGAPDLLASARSLYRWLGYVIGDGGYAVDKLKGAVQWRRELRRAPPPLGGGAHHRLAQPQPRPGKGRRSDRREFGYLAPHRQRQAEVAPSGSRLRHMDGTILMDSNTRRYGNDSS
jgi:hypothetical protein